MQNLFYIYQAASKWNAKNAYNHLAYNRPKQHCREFVHIR